MSMNVDKVLVFKNAFEIQCFRLIIDAYNSSINDKSIKLDWNENDITAELCKFVDTNPLRLKWKLTYNVEHHLPQSEIEKVKGYAAKYPRIDLRLTTFKSSVEFKYFFEAKNLKETDSALKRRYINTGINNFISRKYENGSLVGYLLEGNLDLTIKGINKLLVKDNRNEDVLKPKTFELHKDYFESEHKDIGIMKHLILDFT